MAKDNNQDLLEWYYNKPGRDTELPPPKEILPQEDEDDGEEYVLIKKSKIKSVQSGGGVTQTDKIERVGYADVGQVDTPPDTQDLNPVPPDSPQVDIQQDLLNKALGHQLTMKNDALIATDKANAHKAYTTCLSMIDRLKVYYELAGPQCEDPIKKEGIASDLKTLSRDLADIIGAL